MAYDLELEQAAIRHYQDGAALKDRKRFDNAGYHFGFAAECAVKRKLQTLGVSGGEAVQWAHFPEMRQLALQTLSGRSAAQLRVMLEHDNFMQGWSVKMRYSCNESIDEKTVDRWRDNANDAIGLL